MSQPARATAADYPVLLFSAPAEWTAWLEQHHSAAPGVWLRFAKKGSALASISYAQAVEAALCFGWIDGQARSHDEDSWLQKFTPRGRKSIWSKINRDRVAALLESGRMRPAGLAAVESARADGRWERAYDSPGASTVPEDFQAALDRSPEAKAFFATLKSQNRYGILFRIQTAVKPQTRARKIEQFIAMLERHQTLYPQA